MTALLEEMLRDVSREIAGTKMRLTARITGLLDLIRDGADTIGQDRLLWDDMRTLDDPRRERQVLTEALDRPDLSANAEHLLNIADAKLYLVIEARLRLEELRDRR